MKSIAADIIQTIVQMEDVDLSRLDDSFLLQMIKRRCELMQFPDDSSYPAHLACDAAERQALLLSLNNNYTEFFRNSLTFAHLEHWILPTLIERIPPGRELRIWSAGCSTGQEPYSLAILLENLCEKRQQPFRYRIFATDVSDSALETARKGEYTEEAVQNLRLKDISAYFSRASGHYTALNRIKKHLSFSTYDLFDTSSAIPPESIFGNFNLVVCSNVLIYYNRAAQQLILNKLVHSIMENGYLITGEAERICVSKKAGLCAVSSSNPIFKKVFEVQHEAEQS